MCLTKEGILIAQAWAGQLPNSDALWVRMGEHADAGEVEDAVVYTVQHMLQPNMDVVNDLQVRLSAAPTQRICVSCVFSSLPEVT